MESTTWSDIIWKQTVFTNNAKTRVIWLQEVISVHEVLEVNYPIFLMAGFLLTLKKTFLSKQVIKKIGQGCKTSTTELKTQGTQN